MDNQNFVAAIFNAVFPIINVSNVYVSGVYMPKERTARMFYEAFRECQSKLEKGGSNISLNPEFYMEQLKRWTKQTEEKIFMSLLTYHPEEFYPQQIEEMPGDEDFWWSMYQKEQWETYEHPFLDSWIQEREEITKEMWEEH